MRNRRFLLSTVLVLLPLALLWLFPFRHAPADNAHDPDPARLSAPAGFRAAAEHYRAGSIDGAILPSGRLLTPAGRELSVQAPKPFGLALSSDGKTLATVNSGVAPFSVTLMRNLGGRAPSVQLIPLDATFMGLAFSADSARFYVAGGDDGVVWVGDTAQSKIVGAVNLNGPRHPLASRLDPAKKPSGWFPGSYPAAMALGKTGQFLYVLDQAGFAVITIDTHRIVTGLDAHGLILEPNNFRALAGSVAVGRYPFGIGLSPDGASLFVANVGLFQYAHLTPPNPTGDPNRDYPLSYPAAGYPEETRDERTIDIEKVDPANLPDTLSIPNGVRSGYIPKSTKITVPGLGDPNVPESSSVFGLAIDASTGLPALRSKTKTGPLVGEMEGGIAAFAGSHPNAVAVGPQAVYVSNGNDDSISILDPATRKELRRVSLSPFHAELRGVKGVQPVALALSPNAHWLYVAEAGLNAVAVLSLAGQRATVEGHIPTGWWPSAIQVSADGGTLFIANANGRGSGPNVSVVLRHGDPKYASTGTVNIVPIPSAAELKRDTARVLANNGFVPAAPAAGAIPPQIKHVIFLNKENSTYDQLLGDLTKSRAGTAIAGEPRYSLGPEASPNHHELALEFTVGDNFFLEPSVSSDGHRWLTDNYTTEFEQTSWPANYGDKRNDAGDDPKSYKDYPGRLDFTGDDSPEPNDYDQHGGVFAHLFRNARTFVNFGNGFEVSEVDEDFGTEPTGIRNHVNIPMEKVLRDNSDQLYAEFNTHIPDAPQADDPHRYSRFARFRQIFNAHYVDTRSHACKLPSYVDLYFPNDHGGGAGDINPHGAPWPFRRFVQDNDDALGRTIDLISHSPCWKDTVIFVVEDDTQNGLDHVSGARSLFLAIGPYVKRRYVAKTHYSLSSIFKTVYEILGVPPLNQYDLAATDLRDIFTPTPDFKPYDPRPILFANRASKTWIALSRKIDFSHADADEVKLRRAILLSEGLPRAR